jgi:hypothetical protein
MADPAIERAEVVALLFNVSDIAVTLTNIERLLSETRFRRQELCRRERCGLTSEPETFRG